MRQLPNEHPPAVRRAASQVSASFLGNCARHGDRPARGRVEQIAQHGPVLAQDLDQAILLFHSVGIARAKLPSVDKRIDQRLERFGPGLERPAYVFFNQEDPLFAPGPRIGPDIDRLLISASSKAHSRLLGSSQRRGSGTRTPSCVRPAASSSPKAAANREWRGTSSEDSRILPEPSVPTRRRRAAATI